MKPIQVKPSQLKELLECTINAKLPVLITGAPGIGKSDIVAQAAAAANADLILSHPVVSDPTDAKGLPGIVDGEADFLPFGDLRAAMAATKDTVWFLDDIGQAPPSVQASFMQLLLAREVNGHKISDHVTFVAATNRREDRAGVSGMLEPVKSRFATIVELHPDTKEWEKWALNAGMPVELISFIRWRPNLLNDFKPSMDMTNSPCPRTVAMVGKLMQAGLPKELEFAAFSGAAGEAFAAEFIGFLKIFRNLPDPQTILMSPDTAEVPTDPAVLYALTGALAHRATKDNAPRLFQYSDRLPAEFSVMMTRDSVARCPEIQQSRSFIEWCVKHENVLL